MDEDEEDGEDDEDEDDENEDEEEDKDAENEVDVVAWAGEKGAAAIAAEVVDTVVVELIEPIAAMTLARRGF